MKTFSTKEKLKYLFGFPVIVAALGYFVDIYDLLLFGIVRVPSLKEMGLDVDVAGTHILNFQMIGLLIGGILWGVLGDKKGRLSVLFGSILVYSLANIACGFLPQINFMDKVTAYTLLRFIAGVGLAGELGAGITLVSESLPKELRAIGTSIVAGFGILGAVVAQLTVALASNWTIAYFIGGGLGLLLLILRVSVAESGIFNAVKKDTTITRGNFFSFFTNKTRFIKYLKCIAVGLPIWFCIGILILMANQFAPEMGIATIVPGKAIMWCYLFASIGDFSSGFISHKLHSRKKTIVLYMVFTLIGTLLLLFTGTKSENMYYFYCAWIGLGTGFWAMFVTVAAEQFGTNLRSTAATTIPNVVRGMVPIMLLGFDYLKKSTTVIISAAIIGFVVFAIGFYAIFTSSETHNKEMDFVE
jgi:MFS family permease